jgi:hypothetical protein
MTLRTSPSAHTQAQGARKADGAGGVRLRGRVRPRLWGSSQVTCLVYERRLRRSCLRRGPCFLASHGAAARAHTIQPPGFVRDGCRMNAIQDVPLGVRPWQVKGGFFMVFTKDPSSNIGGKTRGAKKLRRGRGPRGTTCTETKKNEGSP